MRFTKMEGLGNDYVYVNCFTEKVENPRLLARLISDRHRGVGSDGLILIEPSDKADFGMSVYNADGSRAEMCGNGIRCVGKYVYDYGLTDSTELSVDTLAGVKRLHCDVADGKVSSVTVDMGSPVFDRNAMRAELPVYTDGRTCRITCVSLGNPHAVVFTDNVEEYPVDEVGRRIESHPMFPERTNVEFVRVDGRARLTMRVWERGAGETQACGTGACAAAAAAVIGEMTDERVSVRLPGGELKVYYDTAQDKIYMTGPARVVFDGYTDII